MSSRTSNSITAICENFGGSLRYVSRPSRFGAEYRDDSREVLVQRRVELNSILKIAKRCSSSIPHLANKPWARSWRSSYTSDFESTIRRCKKHLALIADRIGPVPTPFKLRPCPGFDKIARRYDPTATMPLWVDAFTRDCEEFDEAAYENSAIAA